MKPHEFIKKIRLEKGIKQETVAKAIFVHKSTYSLYESGNRSMDTATYQKILTFLGVTEIQLVENESEPLTNKIIRYLQEVLKGYSQINSFLMMKMAIKIVDEIDEYSLDENVLNDLTPYFWQDEENPKHFHVGFLLGENDHPIGFNQDGDEVGYGQWIQTYLNQENEYHESIREEIIELLFNEHKGDISQLRPSSFERHLPEIISQPNESRTELIQRLKKETLEKFKKEWLNFLLREDICYVIFEKEIDLYLLWRLRATCLGVGTLKTRSIRLNEYEKAAKVSIHGLHSHLLNNHEAIQDVYPDFGDFINEKRGIYFFEDEDANLAFNPTLSSS